MKQQEAEKGEGKMGWKREAGGAGKTDRRGEI
jgi:hypothetical protein